MCSGVLLLVDAGLTLAWQEPVSAFMASREQSALGKELNGLDKQALLDKQSLASERDVRRRLAKLARLQARRDEEGDPIGRLRMPKLGRSYVVVEGTDLTDLRKGPGHYPKTPLPGEGGTVGVAGHRTTYGAPFRSVDKLKPGDALEMEMPYGRFFYRVDKVQVVRAGRHLDRGQAEEGDARALGLPPALQRRPADRRVLDARPLRARSSGRITPPPWSTLESSSDSNSSTSRNTITRETASTASQ